ncbi:serine/threonine protein kinase [Marinobacter vulgaris]|uniref:non-specific serine/threonine protein kinase n=1 Tax=Marinobacter vulgaris TaxID=1928331 RepID=A0A2V3ZJA2_9GAMM|nr:serine/threonine-protein kinase [Marinobacter vulgaris]PXX90384.1 serine/threonine protein kinase [Marinobacter vulgaris]TSJ69589.1 protein kinase [Marinobacter vulgaris]
MNSLAFLFSRLFSLRLLVVALALIFAFIGDALPALGWLDRIALGSLGNTAGMGDAGTLLKLSPEAFSGALETRGLARPAWSDVAIRGGLMVTALFLVLAVPRMGGSVSLPVILLAAGSLVVLQAALMFYRNAWLPLGEVVTLLVTGYLIMLFWLQPRRDIEALSANVQAARTRLGRLLLQQGQADEALETLAECPPSEETLGLQYDIAIQQERKRQYDRACTTYRQILDQKRRYRDADKRLAALENLDADGTAAVSGNFDSTRTLLMPEKNVSRPTLGRYEIEREIGRGAMGVVYLGKDPKIARTVAIKTLSYAAFDGNELRDLKARFFREAEAAGRLSHPAIVTVYDVGEEADLAFIAMDYARGRPLSEFGKPGRLLPLTTVLDIVARVADALDYAHRQKIIHRDIKPGNIIFNPDNGDIKITDFGIAKISDDSRTRTGSVMGSPLYMSPEQLKGQRVTGASDTYSLGITLYKLVSGETPYQGDTLANLTYQILNKRPKSVREFNAELPNGVVRLINKAIQREPDKRFPSAATMAEALRRQASREAREVTS